MLLEALLIVVGTAFWLLCLLCACSKNGHISLSATSQGGSRQEVVKHSRKHIQGAFWEHLWGKT